MAGGGALKQKLTARACRKLVSRAPPPLALHPCTEPLREPRPRAGVRPASPAGKALRGEEHAHRREEVLARMHRVAFEMAAEWLGDRCNVEKVRPRQVPVRTSQEEASEVCD